MLILSIVGVALVVFGALLLLVFPDRPGGDIAFANARVSSKSAGLPVLALGVFCLGLGVWFARDGAGDNGRGVVTPTPTVSPTLSPVLTSTATPAVTRPHAPDTPGGRSVPAACGPDPKGENFSALSITVQLDENEQTIPTGGRLPNDLRLRLFDGGDFIGVVDLKPQLTGDDKSALFRVVMARGGDCRPATYKNSVVRAGDPSVLQNWDPLRLSANGATYAVEIAYEPANGIKVRNFIKTQ